MSNDTAPAIQVRRCTIGGERAPLLVIDNFVRHPDDLARQAVPRHFVQGGQFFPGIRSRAPRSYQRFLLSELKDLLIDCFELEAKSLKLSMCHYSLVTTRPENLVMAQRVPHFDHVGRDRLASIHYLFRAGYGGTAFYRHRATGFETIDPSRRDTYLDLLETELKGPDAPAAAYINGDTSLFEQIDKQDGAFNRLLVYRGNSLHSGCIDADFVPDPDPRTGRLSINSFIDTGP